MSTSRLGTTPLRGGVYATGGDVTPGVRVAPVAVRRNGEDWSVIWATRNRIAHGYTFIDRAMIEATLHKDLPGFEATLRRLFGELS